MNLKSDIEVANTRAKLARLEARYEALHNETSEDEELREVTLRSLKRYINQFKEEIARYETRQAGQIEANVDRLARRRLGSECELANTRKKLRELEVMYEADEKDTCANEELREITMSSLKRLINQFKEEIARYEAHQPARG